MKAATVFCALATLTSAGAAHADEALTLGLGQSKVITLSENPSTGYSWRIDTEGSEGLDHVAISDLGHKRGAAMPGAPGAHSWRVKALSAGGVTIKFDYQRPWEPAPVETRAVSVTVN